MIAEITETETPDQRALEVDLGGGPFRIGVAEGRWDVGESSIVPKELIWPRRIFWVRAAPREKAPNRFYFCFDFANYPIDAPTGTCWDAESKQTLAIEKRPKGTGQVGKVFRTDWEDGRALYHPYDRVAATSHTEWAGKYPYKIWTRGHTVVDLLTEIYVLLQSKEYTGA
jgi:hypothetical protein